MNKLSMAIGVFMIFGITACQPLFGEKEVTEHYYFWNTPEKVNPHFLVAVMYSQKGLDFICLTTYQADKNTASSRYQLITEVKANIYKDCGLKIGCSVDKTLFGNYEVNVRDIMGIGTTSIYDIDGDKVIPKSFTCGETQCRN